MYWICPQFVPIASRKDLDLQKLHKQASKHQQIDWTKFTLFTNTIRSLPFVTKNDKYILLNDLP